MTNKTKPVYLIIAGILISFVAVIFVFLLIETRNTVEINASESATETQSKPRTSYKNRVDYTEPTEETTVETTPQTSVDNVIRAKGLYRDKKDKVYDSDKNKYETTDGYVFVVYQGNLNKIPVEALEVVEPTEKPKKKKEKATETPKVQSENTSSQNNSYNYNIEDSNSSVSITQSSNVTRPTSKPKKENTIKMNYSSLGVSKGDLFSIVLTGADSSVSWSADGTFIKIYQTNGNQCTFKAHKKGSASVIAQYKGNTYSCRITIS